MGNVTKLLLLGISWTCIANAAPQAVPNRYIVKFKQAVSASSFKALSKSLAIKNQRVISTESRIAVIETVASSRSNAELRLRTSPALEWVQPDHYVTRRATFPKDTNFAEQWALDNSVQSDINAPEAWDFGTGGTDKYGRQVVAAVVDGGVDVNHTSLVDNLWKNPGEIPGNNIDDDGNGYIDDVYGWNVYDNNGTILPDYHGTHVAGIIGARGNDEVGTTGVNWSAHIMSISGSDVSTSVVLAAYNYVLTQKKLWLATAGEKGANVVATNSSFGIDYANCNSGEFPAWNDIYNEMGKAGILSVAATANLDINVDTQGDVPTGCDSPYLVTVTNTTIDGTKYNWAGVGKTNIDLGAPGTNILSTVPNGGIAPLTGTSMATPHVTGAIAFLMSIAPTQFLDFAQNDPGAAALYLKEILITTVTPQTDLADRTVSGGRLNLFGASEKLLSFQ